ncbi:lipoate--protein ligase family protein [bacterium BFN5]|nr:lipoate--protein ligase family protein [bacterium BFN5]
MKWRMINSGIQRAAVNMAVDEAILQAHANGEVPPTIRFYGWEPAAVSMGYFQKADAEINLDRCRKQGIDVVRRLTGGRAVLHAAELTYSVVVRADHPLIPATITASYRYFSGGILAGLKQLGIDACMNIPTGAYGQAKRNHASAACFDAPSQYEITVQGRKLVGSAQVRKDGVVLQHGSILLTFDPEQVASLFNLPAPGMEVLLAGMLAKRAISLSEVLSRHVSWPEVCQAMMDSFGSALGVEVESGQLSQLEQDNAHQLAHTKYSQDSWGD